MAPSNLKWAKERIFPKFEKSLSYVYSEDELGKPSLTVRITRTDEILAQVPIRKR